MPSSSRGPSAATRDFYRILKVQPTASKSEIKEAYRKLAMALHPDMHDGCESKSDEFKALNEAYDTLKDRGKRSAYDAAAGGAPSASRGFAAPPPDYRRVYSPRAPPGFKTFDREKHFSMHYGDGMMREAVDAARRRYERASDRFEGQHEYRSPLGRGFSFDGYGTAHGGNPFSRRPQGPGDAGGGFRVEYEEAHYYDLGSASLNDARRVVNRKETIRDRMQERKKHRVRNRGDPPRTYEESTGCSVM